MAFQGTNFKSKVTRKTIKGRKDRAEAKVKKTVRQQCVDRDGYCRPAKDGVDDGCEGPSQWAHFPDHTRAMTRGRPPEERHTSATSFQACLKHHDQVDGRRTPRLTPLAQNAKGADDVLAWELPSRLIVGRSVQTPTRTGGQP